MKNSLSLNDQLLQRGTRLVGDRYWRHFAMAYIDVNEMAGRRRLLAALAKNANFIGYRRIAEAADPDTHIEDIGKGNFAVEAAAGFGDHADGFG